jgi:hypothetical protein
MKVARYEVPGEHDKQVPSRRDGMILVDRPSVDLWTTTHRVVQLRPSLRDGTFFASTRHFVPGYFHVVPPGQNPQHLSMKSTPLQASATSEHSISKKSAFGPVEYQVEDSLSEEALGLSARSSVGERSRKDDDENRGRKSSEI